MYKVYATKSPSDLTPDYDRLVPYESQERDDAAKRCIELFRKGYTIHKVVLPTGTEIARDHIESALKIGIESVRVAMS